MTTEILLKGFQFKRIILLRVTNKATKIYVLCSVNQNEEIHRTEKEDIQIQDYQVNKRSIVWLQRCHDNHQEEGVTKKAT